MTVNCLKLARNQNEVRSQMLIYFPVTLHKHNTHSVFARYRRRCCLQLVLSCQFLGAFNHSASNVLNLERCRIASRTNIWPVVHEVRPVYLETKWSVRTVCKIDWPNKLANVVYRKRSRGLQPGHRNFQFRPFPLSYCIEAAKFTEHGNGMCLP